MHRHRIAHAASVRLMQFQTGSQQSVAVRRAECWQMAAPRRHLTTSLPCPPPPLVPPAYLALAINFSSLVRDRMSDGAERSVSVDTARPTCSHSWHRLEVRRAVLPSGIRLIVWITVGARRDPTTTPLIERGPPGFSSAGSAARHLPAYEHVYQRRQHLHLSAACAQDLPATTAEAGQTATPSPSPPVVTSASPPTFKSPSSPS
jgi:hypothetical protein